MKKGIRTPGQHEHLPLFPEWEEAKELARQWAERTFTRGRLAELALAVAALALFGGLFFALLEGVRNYRVIGF